MYKDIGIWGVRNTVVTDADPRTAINLQAEKLMTNIKQTRKLLAVDEQKLWLFSAVVWRENSLLKLSETFL